MSNKYEEIMEEKDKRIAELERIITTDHMCPPRLGINQEDYYKGYEAALSVMRLSLKALKEELGEMTSELRRAPSKSLYKIDGADNISLASCENCEAKDKEIERLREAFNKLYYSADKLCKRAGNKRELPRCITDLTGPLYEYRNLNKEIEALEKEGE